MNILLLHHFETLWENSLKKFNTDFENQNNIYIDYILNNKDKLDKVIITRFEGDSPENEHTKIISICEKLNIDIEFIEYGYGWTREKDDDEEYDDNLSDYNENKTWCYGKRDYHDGVTDILMIDDWMQKLKADNIFLGGSFEGECVCDIETALNAIEIEVIKCDDLIVGTYVDYEFKTGLNNIDSLINSVFEIDDKYEEIDGEFNLDKLSKVNFKIIEKDLMELELEINNKIYNNLELISLFELEDEIYSSINNENLIKIIEKVIDFKVEFNGFSKLKEKFNSEIIKSTKKVKRNLTT